MEETRLKDPIGTPATSFNEREMQICTVARMVEDAKTYWVAGGGGPMYAVLIAIKLYAPAAQYITEDGVIAPEPMLPFEPVMTMVSSRAGYRALAWGTMNTAGNHAQLGLMDYGILNTLQVDQHGNINSTAIGEYGERSRRFGGPGGADSIAAHCWRTHPDDRPGEAQVRRARRLHFVARIPRRQRGRTRARGAAAGHRALARRDALGAVRLRRSAASCG